MKRILKEKHPKVRMIPREKGVPCKTLFITRNTLRG